MQTGFGVIALRNVPYQTQDFALFIDRDRLVALGLDIEPANLGMFESADRSNRGAADVFLIGNFRDASEGFLRRVQDKDERPLSASDYNLRFHPIPPRED
jgi:hypothetical protein